MAERQLPNAHKRNRGSHMASAVWSKFPIQVFPTMLVVDWAHPVLHQLAVLAENPLFLLSSYWFGQMLWAPWQEHFVFQLSDIDLIIFLAFIEPPIGHRKWLPQFHISAPVAPIRCPHRYRSQPFLLILGYEALGVREKKAWPSRYIPNLDAFAWMAMTSLPATETWLLFRISFFSPRIITPSINLLALPFEGFTTRYSSTSVPPTLSQNALVNGVSVCSC